MSKTPLGAASHLNYQTIFNDALESYKEKTGKDLTLDPLFRKLKACHSPGDIIAILREQGPGPSQPRGSGNKWTNWLNPTVNVLSAFSATVAGGVGMVYPPAWLVFTGIGVLLSAATVAFASQDALADLFGRIETVFRRLEIYLEIPLGAGMKDVMVKIMTESSAKTFVKKLVGRTDIDDALKRLEKLALEEAGTAAAESLRVIHGVGNQVMGVDDKVHGMRATLKVVDDRVRRVEGMLQGLEGMLQDVDERVRDIGVVNDFAWVQKQRSGRQGQEAGGAPHTKKSPGQDKGCLRNTKRHYQCQRTRHWW
ncbi:hypothetical protein F5148DRAFT_1350100 [Russula earlei]|uniref:Uncharacterized protein n=1 Tax=Russula earlei TaxID=71964 RepID=A0ACC0UBK8_9AGAM|nr:hypothetical protein F5148DRAFT_1350100 [Russula earlei]